MAIQTQKLPKERVLSETLFFVSTFSYSVVIGSSTQDGFFKKTPVFDQKTEKTIVGHFLALLSKAPPFDTLHFFFMIPAHTLSKCELSELSRRATSAIVSCFHSSQLSCSLKISLEQNPVS